MNKTSFVPEWWEKTVEYAFVQNFLPDASLVTPLDGKPEQYIGDLLLNNSGKWFLIEFKRERSSIKDELEKYLKCNSRGKMRTEAELKEAIKREAGTGHVEWIHKYHPNFLKAHLAATTSHFFVYGECASISAGLSLCYLPYWSESNRVKITMHHLTNKDEARDLEKKWFFKKLRSGFPFKSVASSNQMMKYLNELSKLRGNGSIPSGDSGGSGILVVFDEKIQRHIAFGMHHLLEVAIKKGLIEQEKSINGG